MNPEVKSQWLSALRSGEFKQGMGVLLTENNEYCCLGVLCELHRRAHPEHSWVLDGKYSGQNYIDSGSTLPQAVQQWAGLPNDNPTPSGSEQSLAEDNDDGVDFNAIADKIEAGL